MKSLAINGGTPIAQSNEWFKWPAYGQNTLNSLKSVLESARWTLSGFKTTTQTFDEKFCKDFSSFNKTKFALTVDHGSSAIILALQSLGISFGDEVILPGLTWVSCASSVLKVNAKPVFADVENHTLCIDPSNVEELITPKTRAIIIVHLYSTMCNMDRLIKISKKYNIPIIEDCSQSHGSEWAGQKAGSIGNIGIFSMQQGKPLTSGEGAAIITNDEYLYNRMILLKTDGRSINRNVPVGYQELQEESDIIGSNFNLSEFQCAVLYENLKGLDCNLKLQREQAKFLEKRLSIIPGLSFVIPHAKNTLRTYYHFIVFCDLNFFGKTNIQRLSEVLSRELSFFISPIYKPLYRHKLFQVCNDSRFDFLNLNDFNKIYLKNCEEKSISAIGIHHSVLLSSIESISKIPLAFEKIQKYASEL